MALSGIAAKIKEGLSCSCFEYVIHTTLLLSWFLSLKQYRKINHRGLKNIRPEGMWGWGLWCTFGEPHQEVSAEVGLARVHVRKASVEQNWQQISDKHSRHVLHLNTLSLFPVHFMFRRCCCFNLLFRSKTAAVWKKQASRTVRGVKQMCFLFVFF